jgi:hypothetical protein
MQISPCTFQWYCDLWCSILMELLYMYVSFVSFLIYWSWLLYVPFTWIGIRAHGGCNWSRQVRAILPLVHVCPEDCVYPILICFSYRTYEIDGCPLSMPFRRNKYLGIQVHSKWHDLHCPLYRSVQTFIKRQLIFELAT